LINRSRILKVAPEAGPLLDMLERGDNTLTQICATFGQPALNLVGYLYDNRLVVLNRNGTMGAYRDLALAGCGTGPWHADGAG
jgi:hypothetical protein